MVRGDNSLHFATALDNSGLLAGKADAVGIIQRLAKDISKINPFAALAVGATAAFAVIADGAFKMARDFESAMAEVRTIAGLNDSDFRELSESVFSLSRALGTEPPDKLANGLYEIIGAGFEASEALKILEISSKAATAGVTTSGVASDGLTTILNAFRLEAEKATEVADIMFATVDRGKISFEELSSNIAIVAPLAASSGISFQEVGAAISSLTKQGVPASVAITQIRSAIIATNEILGDGAFKSQTFQEALQMVADLSGGSQNKLKELAGRIEAVNAVLALTGPNMQGAVEDLEAMENAAGSVDRSFKTITSTDKNQWEILRNRIKTSTKGIGDAILEMSSGIARFFNDALEPSDRVIVNLEKQRIKLLEVESRIKDTNTTNEDRITLIKELKNQYPDLLKNIDAEKVSNQELSQSIKDINEQLINKIILQRQDNKISDQNEDTAEKRIELLKQEDRVRESLVKIAEREGKTIKDNATLVEQGRDLLSQFTDEQLRGGRLINPLVEFGFQLSELVTLQKSLNFEEEKGAKLLKEREELAKRLGITLNNNADGGTGGNDETPTPDPDLLTYEEYLKKKRDLYQEYENYINQVGQEKADERFRDLLKEGKNYGEFLIDQLSKARTFERERAVINAAADADLRLQRNPVEKINVEILPIVKDVKIDTESIKAIERRLSKLNELYEKSQSDAEKEVLGEKIRIENQKLDAANKFRNEEKELYEELNRSISDLNNKELRSYISRLREKLRVEKLTTQQILELKGQIQQAEEAIGNNTEETIQKINGVLNEASSLFRKFGDEDTAQLLDQLAGVGQGIADIAKGVATNNPFDIIKGSLAVVNSALTVEVVSDTAKFEAAIKELEKAIDRLDYVISKSLGQDKITSRQQAIRDLEELEKQADLAYDAELEARKQVKLLGITIGKKGSGSGTDPAKLEELEKQAEEARRKVVELRNEINELYTGTTSSSLADSIIEGFKEGRRSAADFADDFEELMRNAMFEALKLKYLEKASNDFFEQFGALAGDDNGLTSSDINTLRNLAQTIFSNSVEELEALDKILQEAGIAGGTIGGAQQSGLAGSISTITEETANILAGTLNSIRLDVREGVEIALQSSEYLAQIVNNTSYNQRLELLESIDRKLGDIQSAVNQFESQGL